MQPAAPVNPKRRRLLRSLGAASLLGLSPQARSTKATTSVVVVGGGFAGATCARALKRLMPELMVTVVEPRSWFFTGPMSNAVVGGQLNADAIRFDNDALARLGIAWRPQRVVTLDRASRSLQLADGSTLTADLLVLAPGIALNWHALHDVSAKVRARCPSAWLGDAEVTQLRDRVAQLDDGAHVIISAPALPYRCPPGPYERAAMIAYAAHRCGKRIRITVLDSKDDFSKRSAFIDGWARHYPGVIEWVPRARGGQVTGFARNGRAVVTADGETINADLINVIPPQQAPEWMQAAGLCDEQGWCPVDAFSFASPHAANTYVIGDAASVAPVPKSAFAAQAQAELCALAIHASLLGLEPAESLMLNTCYSLLHDTHAISVAASFAATEHGFERLSEGASAPGLPAAIGAREAADAMAWYRRATQRAFGG